MIEEVKMGRPDANMAMVLSIIGGGQAMPDQVEPGILVATHWNVGDLLGSTWDKYWFSDDETLPPSYGVCDSIDQFKAKYLDRLKGDDQHQYAVSFVVVRKVDQDPRGGWRWHKWGEYIGEREPQHEYLYDEDGIDEVYTFAVHRRAVAGEKTRHE